MDREQIWVLMLLAIIGYGQNCGHGSGYVIGQARRAYHIGFVVEVKHDLG